MDKTVLFKESKETRNYSLESMTYVSYGQLLKYITLCVLIATVLFEGLYL